MPITAADVVRPNGWLSYSFDEAKKRQINQHLADDANARVYWNYYRDNPQEFSALEINQQVKILSAVQWQNGWPEAPEIFRKVIASNDALKEQLGTTAQFQQALQDAKLKSHLKKCYLDKNFFDAKFEFLLQILPAAELIKLAKDDREIATALCRKMLLLSNNPQKQAEYLLAMNAYHRENPIDFSSRQQGLLLANPQVVRQHLKDHPEKIIDVIRVVKDAQQQRKFASQLIKAKALNQTHDASVLNHYAFSSLAEHIAKNTTDETFNKWWNEISSVANKFKEWIKTQVNRQGDDNAQKEIKRVLATDAVRKQCDFSSGDSVLKLLEVEHPDPVICQHIALDRNLWAIVKKHYTNKMPELFAKHPVFFIQSKLEVFGAKNLPAFRIAMMQLICVGKDFTFNVVNPQTKKEEPKTISSVDFYIQYKGFKSIGVWLEKDEDLFKEITNQPNGLLQLLQLANSEVLLARVVNDPVLLQKILAKPGNAKALLQWVLQSNKVNGYPQLKIEILKHITSQQLLKLAESNPRALEFIQQNPEYCAKALEDLDDIVKKLAQTDVDEKAEKQPEQQQKYTQKPIQLLVQTETKKWLDADAKADQQKLDHIIKETPLIENLLDEKSFQDYIFTQPGYARLNKLLAAKKQPLTGKIIDHIAADEKRVMQFVQCDNPQLKALAIQLVSDNKYPRLLQAFVDFANQQPTLLPDLIDICVKNPHWINDNPAVKEFFSHPKNANQRLLELLNQNQASIKIQVEKLIADNPALALQLVQSGQEKLQQLVIAVCNEKAKLYQFELFLVLLNEQVFVQKNTDWIWSVINKNRGEFERKLSGQQLKNLLALRNLKLNQFVFESAELCCRLADAKFDFKPHVEELYSAVIQEDKQTEYVQHPELVSIIRVAVRAKMRDFAAHKAALVKLLELSADKPLNNNLFDFVSSEQLLMFLQTGNPRVFQIIFANHNQTVASVRDLPEFILIHQNSNTFLNDVNFLTLLLQHSADFKAQLFADSAKAVHVLTVLKDNPHALNALLKDQKDDLLQQQIKLRINAFMVGKVEKLTTDMSQWYFHPEGNVIEGTQKWISAIHDKTSSDHLFYLASRYEDNAELIKSAAYQSKFPDNFDVPLRANAAKIENKDAASFHYVTNLEIALDYANAGLFTILLEFNSKECGLNEAYKQPALDRAKKIVVALQTKIAQQQQRLAAEVAAHAEREKQQKEKVAVQQLKIIASPASVAAEKTTLPPASVPQREISSQTTASDALGQLLQQPLSREYRVTELLRRPEINYALLLQCNAMTHDNVDTKVAEQVEIQAKYGGYIERQLIEIKKQSRHEETVLPIDLDYQQVSGLSAEVKEKLNKVKPLSIGQASRIAGVTPAAISLLLVHLKKRGSAEQLAA